MSLIIKLQIIAFVFLLSISANSQMQNNGNFKIHAGANMGIFGDFTNNGTFTENLGTLHITGSNAQTFNGTTLIHVNNLLINKPGNALQLDNELQISGSVAFINGKILSDHADKATEFVHFLDNSSYSGSSNASHIDGVIRKTGNDVFVFPSGDNNLIRTSTISAPANIADHFTSYYSAENPGALYDINALEAGLNHVSGCEYWIIDRTAGSSNVEVTLSWSTNSCGIDNLCELTVSRWDGTKWTSGGNGGTTGTTSSGRVVSGNSCTTPGAITNFSPFTLGSTSTNNPLPIELVAFEATICEDNVCLFWQTASEKDNNYFIIERSKNGIDWVEVVIIESVQDGNSNSLTDYNTKDHNPYSDISYYRLSQTDFNEIKTYSKIKSVKFDASDFLIEIFPNPSNNQIAIKGKSAETNLFKFFNTLGRDVTHEVSIINKNELLVQLDISSLSAGIYTITTKTSVNRFLKL